METTAVAGGFVLAPPRAWVDAALEKGAERQTFIFYGGWMKAPGPQASEIETLTGLRQVIPNPLIVALPRGQRAKRGQVVITAWASGTGMQRAIVVDGGDEASPEVRYLDMSLESPSGWGGRTDKLPKDTFATLDDSRELGRTAACKEGAHRMRYVVVQKQGDRLLGYGFAGKLAAFNSSDCVVLSLHPHLNKGDWVSVPVVGRYTRSKVRRVDDDIGRVWAKYKSDGDDQVTAFSIIDAAINLE